MVKDAPSTRLKGKSSGGKRKVKSGCRTCKIRKVKCDEAFPVCHRCVSTGRICEGYGIWGGGGGGSGGSTGVGHITAIASPCLLGQKGKAKSGYGSITGPLYSPDCHYPIILDAGDKACFEWFKHRSAPKLPGTFITGFWTKLIFQAASSEPAVLHAVLALGTVHRRPTLSDDTAGTQEVITLRHYTKAIGHLQHHLTARNRASLHVSLISCALFICLELLRGHFDTAHRHMENGLKVLADGQKSLSTCATTLSSMLQPRAKMLDGWILEMFSRLRLQFRLFNQCSPQPCFDLAVTLNVSLPSDRLHSANEAWKYLSQLLDRAMEIANQVKDGPNGASQLSPAGLRELQQRNKADLARWLSMYIAARDTICTETPREDERVKLYYLILQYYMMAEIMTATCMSPNDELSYDSQTSKFISIIENSIALLKTSPGWDSHVLQSGRLLYESSSIIDMGWIAPLYYTAVKCRVHRIRAQAARLLATSDHQEGIWDSKTSVCVARKVIELEERDFYSVFQDGIDEFPLLDCPREEDLVLPTLPESHRIHGIETKLHGEPLDEILLTCSQRQDGADQTVLVGKYGVASKTWESKTMI